MAEGNLMVRTRAVLNYLAANHRDALVLGTGNKSEALVGYFTKYGDGAVDCHPIANLYKAPGPPSGNTRRRPCRPGGEDLLCRDVGRPDRRGRRWASTTRRWTPSSRSTSRAASQVRDCDGDRRRRGRHRARPRTQHPERTQAPRPAGPRPVVLSGLFPCRLRTLISTGERGSKYGILETQSSTATPRKPSARSHALRRPYPSDEGRGYPAQATRPRLALSFHQDRIARATEALTFDSPPLPDSARPRRITRPDPTARPGARFIARPTERRHTSSFRGPHSLRSRGWGRAGLRCRAWRTERARRAGRSTGAASTAAESFERREAPFVMTRELRSLEPRGAQRRPRESSPPRAFWLLAVSLLPVYTHQTTHSVQCIDRTLGSPDHN